jgi:hypothetical protein
MSRPRSVLFAVAAATVLVVVLLTRSGDPVAVVSYEFWFVGGTPVAGELVVETGSGIRETVPVTVPGVSRVDVPRDEETIITVVAFGHRLGLRCYVEIVGSIQSVGSAFGEGDSCRVAFDAGDLIDHSH